MGKAWIRTSDTKFFNRSILTSGLRQADVILQVITTFALPTELLPHFYFKERFLLWYRLESNQGHTDFQSVALPTELRHHMPEILAPGLYNRLQAFLPDDTCRFRSAMRSSFQLRDALRDCVANRNRTDVSGFSDQALQDFSTNSATATFSKLSWVRSSLTQAIGITHSALYGFIVLSFASTIVFNKKRT